MFENDNYSLMGLRIEQRRKELNLTLQEVAADVGVAASTIQRYEKGRFGKIKLPVIEAIAAALQVNPEWLIGDTDDPVDYDDPDIIAAIPQEYMELYGGDIRRAYKTTQLVVGDDLKEIVKENRRRRLTAVVESSCRCGNVLKRKEELLMKALIREVEPLSPKQVEDIIYLVKAYLKAEQPIRDIVNTALRPYKEGDTALCEDQIG